MNNKKVILIWLIIAAFLLSVAPLSIVFAEADSSRDYDLDEIRDSWHELPDEELNDYFGNNNDTDIHGFISEMSEEERTELLSKETMLNNTITIDEGNGKLEKMPYYDWIMKNGKTAEPMMQRQARGVVSTFTAKSGYCFYRFVDNDSGYIVRYKVTFTLDSTSNAESEYNNYKVASVIYGTGGTNSNNTALDEVTFTKQKTYMKKGATKHEVLGDGSKGSLKNGEMVYPTAITPIFVLTVKVPKPINTYGKWANSGFTMNGVAQTIAEGSRFNLREYNWQGTGDSTFDDKVYHQKVTDTLTSCINILSCGFGVENENPLGLSNGVPEHDTINVVYNHPTLNLDCYVNGGTVTANSNNSEAENPVRRSVLYNEYYNSKYGLPAPSSLGFSRDGYTPAAGKEWKSSDGTKTWAETDVSYKAVDLLDYEDGTYFTSKKRSLYVNWEPNVYEVILDNQGADYSGTESTWYRYNTYGTQTLSDGAVQKNYFYTTDTLETPLKDGYKIVLPKKEGYIFKGYYMEKNGQGTQYVNEEGEFINQLWKQIGPHTLYALWEEKPPEYGRLIIRRNLEKSDYYSVHGDATFLFRIRGAEGNTYYRSISFGEEDMGSEKNGIVTLETECVLPYGNYSVEAMEVFRYQNKLTSIAPGTITSAESGDFRISGTNLEVVAIYDGSKTDWQRFSHNDLVINRLKDQ